MKDFSSQYPSARTMRVWFYADTDNIAVKKVQGFSCAPHNQEIWWCPEAGYSLSEKHQLFTSAPAAKEQVLKEAKAELDRIKAAITNLENTIM